MYDLLKALISSLLMPLPFVIGFIFIGLILVSLRYLKLASVFIALGLISLFLFSWAPFADKVLEPFERQYPPYEANFDRPVKYIVVLGGGWFPEDTVSNVSRLSESSLARLSEGVRIWQMNPVATLVVSGASRDASIAPVAEGYRLVAVDLGVPSESIKMLQKPTDTAREAKAFADVVKSEEFSGSDVILVTSASHMPRAMRYFRAQGFDPVAAPTHFLAQPQHKTFKYWVPSAFHLRKTERAWYEFLASFAVRVEQ